MLKKDLVKEIRENINKVYSLEEEYYEIIEKYKSIKQRFIVPEFELYTYGAHMNCYREFYKAQKMSDSKLMRMKKIDLESLLSDIKEVVDKQSRSVEVLLWEEKMHIELQIERMTKVKSTEEKILIKSAVKCFSHECGYRTDLVTLISNDNKTYICKARNYDNGLKSKEPAGFIGKYVEIPDDAFWIAQTDHADETIKKHGLFPRLDLEQIKEIRQKIKSLEL